MTALPASELCLVVSDLEAMMSFYEQTLGYREVARAQVKEDVSEPNGLGGPFEMVWLHRSGAGMLKLLQSQVGTTEQPVAPLSARRGYAFLTHHVPDLAAVRELMLHLGARPISAAPQSVGPGLLVCFVADPEGNAIELAQREAT